jgi:hypothetical protein
MIIRLLLMLLGKEDILSRAIGMAELSVDDIFS